MAYYPSKFPLHYRAQFLNGRDLFGELTEAAHKDGIFVMARMNSNRTTEDFFTAHPDWFTRDRDGKPYHAAGTVVGFVPGLAVPHRRNQYALPPSSISRFSLRLLASYAN